VSILDAIYANCLSESPSLMFNKYT